jgi:predicted  nucleic acid-binding Zn-ribbon protein
MAPEDEMAMLKEDANAIRDELDAINKRIEELQSQKTEA